MGNINPVNNMIGISMPIREISIAACWESVLFEIKSPSESAVKMSKLLSAKKSRQLPGKVNVSHSTYMVCKDDFESRGQIAAKKSETCFEKSA